MGAEYYTLDDSMIDENFVPWAEYLEESSRNNLIKSINNILKAEEVKAPDEYNIKKVETFDDLVKLVKNRLQDIKLGLIEKQSYSTQDQQTAELANQTKEESKEKPTGIPTKNLIISKLDNLFEKTSEEGTKVIIYGNFKSGDSEIRLKGKGNTYEITINGTSVREFQDFSRALADFYDQINLLLRSKEKDVDTDFQIFSEVIRNQNMKVVPLLSQLNKSLDAEKIGRLEKWYDFNSFNKEDFFAKYNSSCESCKYFRNIEKEGLGCFCNDDILKSTNSLCLNYVYKAVPQMATGVQPMPNEPELTRDVEKPEKADPKHQIHLHPEEEFPLLGKSKGR